MKIQIVKKLAVCLGAVSTIGCSGYTSGPQAGLIGGIAGAGAGAGIGAIIGEVIDNGDVAKSALLGTAIGLPVGIILGVAYNNYQYNSLVDDNQEIIDENAEVIRAHQARIDELRAQYHDEASQIELDESNAATLYDGPTLGQYRR